MNNQIKNTSEIIQEGSENTYMCFLYSGNISIRFSPVHTLVFCVKDLVYEFTIDELLEMFQQNQKQY